MTPRSLVASLPPASPRDASSFSSPSRPSARCSSPATRYGWEEVAKHSTAASCWVQSGGGVFDITHWLDRHPGGREVLLLCAGRDITDLLRSYHPFDDKAQRVLASYRIGDSSSTEFPHYRPDSGFYRDCRAEVAQYFRDTGLNCRAAEPLLWRLLALIAVAAVCYAAVVRGQLPLLVRATAAVVFGVCQALVLFHCVHDGSHYAIGGARGAWTWLARLTMDCLVGGSMLNWRHQHLLGHHLYTNVQGVDPDLPHPDRLDIRRVCSQQRWGPLYAFQSVYLIFLYCLVTLKFRSQDLTCILLWGDNHGVRLQNISATDKVVEVVTKLGWLAWRLGLPLLCCSGSAAQYVGLSLLMELVSGGYMAFNFQVSHVSVLADFYCADGSPFDEEWAPSQLHSSVDFAYDSWLVTFLAGALNYQSVHHLFPGVSQYHYPALAPIVRRVAAKHRVRHNYVSGFWDAVSLHFAHLQDMGRRPPAAGRHVAALLAEGRHDGAAADRRRGHGGALAHSRHRAGRRYQRRGIRAASSLITAGRGQAAGVRQWSQRASYHDQMPGGVGARCSLP